MGDQPIVRKLEYETNEVRAPNAADVFMGILAVGVSAIILAAALGIFTFAIGVLSSLSILRCLWAIFLVTMAAFLLLPAGKFLGIAWRNFKFKRYVK